MTEKILPFGEYKMTQDKYDEYRQKFRSLLDLSDKALDKALPGRKKYCPRRLRPLPFEGISVIHNIDHERATDLGLARMAESIVSTMKDAKLGQKIAFVSTKSFHATTFDLINHGGHAEKLQNAGFAYEQVRASVEKEALAFMKQCAPMQETIAIAGLGMFCPRVLKLDLHINADVLTRFQAFRRELHAHLCDNVSGYPTVRERDWDRDLSAHITFGYFVNPLQEPEIACFLDILRNFNQGFSPIEFQLTQGEVTRFTDMDHYEAIWV